MTATEDLIAEAREFDTAPAEYAARLRGAHSLIARLADALAAVPAPTEADSGELSEVLRRIYIEARDGATTPEKSRAGLIAVYEAGKRASVPAPKTQDGEAREALENLLLSHEPESRHREAYCSCGAPIGEWGEEFFGHMADAVLARYTLVPVSPEGEKR